MIKINALCDECHSQIQPFAFDSDEETCSQLKQAMQTAGWDVGSAEGTAFSHTRCPSCVRNGIHSNA